MPPLFSAYGSIMGKLAKSRAKSTFTSPSGEMYLEGMRVSLSHGAGKSLVVNQIIDQIRSLSSKNKSTLEIADFGSCEGDMLAQISSTLCEQCDLRFTGFDYNHFFVEKAKENYPHLNFEIADILSSDLSDYKDKFDIVYTINTLHEISSFSNSDNPELKGKENVKDSIRNILQTLKPGGMFIAYDGIDHDVDPHQKITISLANNIVENNLLKFATEYIQFQPEILKKDEMKYEMNVKTFTAFITKYRFLDSLVWQFEKEERYQYYNKQEWIRVLNSFNLSVMTLLMLRPRIAIWQDLIKILTPGIDFPFEHVFLIATKD